MTDQKKPDQKEYTAPTLAVMGHIDPLPAMKIPEDVNFRDKRNWKRRADRKYPTGDNAKSKQSMLPFASNSKKRANSATESGSASAAAAAATPVETSKKTKPNRMKIIHYRRDRFVAIPDEDFRKRIGASNPMILVKIGAKGSFDEEDLYAKRIETHITESRISLKMELWKRADIDVVLTADEVVSLFDLKAKNLVSVWSQAYEVRVTEYRGAPLQEVLKSAECLNCVVLTEPVTHPKLQVTLDHAIKIVQHVVHTVLTMKHCIKLRTDDLYNGNLVIRPTNDELKSGVLSLSLPVMIDFEACQVDPSESECVNLLRTWLANCVHGTRKLDKHQYPWLAEACNGDKDKCTRYITGVIKCETLEAMLDYKLA